MARDIIAELMSDPKNQSVRSPDFEQHMHRLLQINVLNEHISRLKFTDDDGLPWDLTSEIERHLIVSLVSVIQSTMKTLFALVIDLKDKQGETLPEPQSQLKLTISIVRELTKKSFTIGQLMAHTCTISGLDILCSY